MDVKGAMSGNDIVEALTDKQFSVVNSGKCNFNKDGSGVYNQHAINWEVRENQLLINKKVTGALYANSVCDVYNVLPDYYLLVGEDSSSIEMVLLKSQ